MLIALALDYLQNFDDAGAGLDPLFELWSFCAGKICSCSVSYPHFSVLTMQLRCSCTMKFVIHCTHKRFRDLSCRLKHAREAPESNEMFVAFFSHIDVG